MKIKEHLFNIFNFKDESGQEIKLGYVLEGEPKTYRDLEKLFKAFNLESKFHSFKPLIRHKIDLQLTPHDDSIINIGQSRIGGKPDLKDKNVWPKTKVDKSLSFIGQINCEEVAPFDKDGILPKKGMISFFYCADQEAWGFDPNDIDRFKVIFTENMEELKPIEFPKDLEEHSKFKYNTISFSSSLSLPGWEHPSIEGVLKDTESDNYVELSLGADNQMFGYANCIQGPMELECQLVTNGLFCGDSTGYNDPKRKELESEHNEWVLLLQIDSEEEKTGMMWGDVGRIYFWIKKQDLKNRKFENCWVILQCC